MKYLTLPTIRASGVFQKERRTVTVKHVAVIHEDNPRVNVAIDPKRKCLFPLIENRLSLSYCHMEYVALQRTTRHIASGFYWRPSEFFSGFSTSFIMQNVEFSAYSYRGLPRRSFRQPLYRGSLIMFTWRELEENAADAYAHRSAAFLDNVN